jgi:hypothetical protein
VPLIKYTLSSHLGSICSLLLTFRRFFGRKHSSLTIVIRIDQIMIITVTKIKYEEKAWAGVRRLLGEFMNQDRVMDLMDKVTGSGNC